MVRTLLTVVATSFRLVMAVGFVGTALAVGGVPLENVVEGTTILMFLSTVPLTDLPQVLQGGQDLERLYRTLALIEASPSHDGTNNGGPADTGHDAAPVPPSRPPTLALDQVSFRYDESRRFAVGPVSLTLPPGEITFLVGGNGSGKSTLLKVILGLYQPTSGRLLMDGKAVDMREHRDLFATVFLDAHVFERLFGLETVDPAQVAALLKEMELIHKTDFRNGRFTTVDLSTGQKKRLALVAARLENRPVMVLDEWAADQDPGFRHWFYEVLLPALKAEGRTVIAVTHDDWAFDAADQVVHLDFGQVTRITRRGGLD